MREAFAMQSFTHFFNKTYRLIWDIKVWFFNDTLTNDVVSFEQPSPGFEYVVSIYMPVILMKVGYHCIHYQQSYFLL